MSWIRATTAVGVSLLLLSWAVLRPELMVVERIEFAGMERATQAELRHLADIRNGASFWSVDLERASQGVQRHPWVARVRAERRLPGTIVLTVEEYSPVALLGWGDALYYVDAGGTPFLEAASDDLDYPVLTGIDPSLEQAHPLLPRWAVHDALQLVEELDRRGLVARDQVSEVGFSRSRGFTLQTTGALAGRATARVLFGLGHYERQLRHLAGLLGGGLDLTQPLHVDVAPERVAIVRPLDAGPGFAAW